MTCSPTPRPSNTIATATWSSKDSPRQSPAAHSVPGPSNSRRRGSPVNDPRCSPPTSRSARATSSSSTAPARSGASSRPTPSDPTAGNSDPTELSINKIGHAQHDLDPVFEQFTYTPQLAEVAHDIGLHDPLALQSMYIFKQPDIGGEVGCHQDATFLYTDPIASPASGSRSKTPRRQRLPVGRSRRSPHRPPPGVRTQRRQRRRPHTVPRARPRSPPPATRRPRTARGAGRHARGAARSAAPLERREPVGCQPPRVQRPLHLAGRRLPVVELAATSRHLPLRRLDAGVTAS
jgi:hypothetical protein